MSSGLGAILGVAGPRVVFRTTFAPFTTFPRAELTSRANGFGCQDLGSRYRGRKPAFPGHAEPTNGLPPSSGIPDGRRRGIRPSGSCGPFGSGSHLAVSLLQQRAVSLTEKTRLIPETWKCIMANEASGSRFGYLPPTYHFSLNPYPEMRFSSCPDCKTKTGQRKLPLLIHIDPLHLIALNYTHKYCPRCDMLIGHKHEIEHHLTAIFGPLHPEVIGNNYLILGTVEKKAWRKNRDQSPPLEEMRRHTQDFKSFQEIRMTMGGWFPKDQDPPVMEPLPSEEWVKPSCRRQE